jgi:polysaccharide pyruvyl transferase CsaB
MSDKWAVICGYYGKGNGGDEALLLSLLQMLPENIKPIVLSGNPAETKKRYGVESCDRKSTFTILKVFRRADFFIWGGGSLMQDTSSFASPFYYAGLMALAQQQGLKTIAWAQGIGPLKYSQTRWVTKQVLLGCAGVSVRDSGSAQLVSNWQIPVVLAPDPVWALESREVRGVLNLSAPKVAVCLRPHSQLTPQRLAILTQALIDFQKATSTCILLVPFQLSKDLAIAESIASQLPGEHQIVSLEDPRELKGLFKQVKMTIGMRFHSLIMAAAEGCRCFALGYDPKVSQLMSELNLPGYELEELPEDSQVISATWQKYYWQDLPLDTSQIQSSIDRAFIHQQLLIKVCGN